MIVLSGILLLIGCHDGLFYTRYKAPAEKGWSKKRGLVFELPKVEKQSAYNVHFATRIWNDYEYKNLRLIARLYEDKKMVSVDTISFNFYDKQNSSLSQGIAMTEFTEPLQRRYVLKPKHKYKLKVYHHMLKDPLRGIADVGVVMSEK